MKNINNQLVKCISVLFLIGINVSFPETGNCQNEIIQNESKSLKLVAGTSVNAKFSFDIRNEFYIPADHPEYDTFIPTRLVLEPVPGMTTGEVRFINDNSDFDLNSGKMQKVYSGELDVVVPITLNDYMNRGEYELKGCLIYQPCANHECFIARNYEFVIRVMVL